METIVAGLMARSSASGWVLCILVITGLFSIWRRQTADRPQMAQIEQDGEEKLRSEMWKDIEALKVAKNGISTRLTLAEGEIATQKVEIGQQRFLLKLVITELEIVSPNNPIAKQARLLMDAVQPAAFPLTPREPDADLVEKLRGVAQ